MGDRPHVRIDPAQRSGDPVVKGIRVATLADMVWAGLDWPEEIYAEYGMNRGDVLVACWYMGVYGPRSWRRRWGAWAEAVHPALWRAERDYDTIPDPPTSDDASVSPIAAADEAAP